MNMKKMFISIITILLLLAINFGSVLAGTNVTLYLPAQQIWTASRSATRSLKYEYVRAGCDSVYPTSGEDTFKKIQVRVTESGNVITEQSKYTLVEGDGIKKIKIANGYLDKKTVWFSFRGNTSSAAYAVVDYYGE